MKRASKALVTGFDNQMTSMPDASKYNPDTNTFEGWDGLLAKAYHAVENWNNPLPDFKHIVAINEVYGWADVDVVWWRRGATAEFAVYIDGVSIHAGARRSTDMSRIMHELSTSQFTATRRGVNAAFESFASYHKPDGELPDIKDAEPRVVGRVNGRDVIRESRNPTEAGRRWRLS